MEFLPIPNFGHRPISISIGSPTHSYGSDPVFVTFPLYLMSTFTRTTTRDKQAETKTEKLEGQRKWLSDDHKGQAAATLYSQHPTETMQHVPYEARATKGVNLHIIK